jgi:aquaporin Z
LAGTLRALLAELVGAFAWTALAAGAVVVDAASGGRLGPVGVALAQGLAAAAVFGALGREAPALFNPAFAFALAVLRRLDAARAALCAFAQLSGASLAALFLTAVFHHSPLLRNPPHLGACHSTIGFREATLVEAVLTFFLALASHRLLQQDRRSGPSWALAVGAWVGAAALFAGGLTGAALNPARAFGPAMLSMFWAQHYVYWVGPVTGAVLGFAASEFLLAPK